MALTSILIDLLQRHYLRKIDRYLAHLDGVYCVEYADTRRKVSSKTYKTRTLSPVEAA